MSTVKERTCDSPSAWKALKGKCHCPACRGLYNEYQREMYQARKYTKTHPRSIEEVRLSKKERMWKSKAVLGLATRCPMCSDWTSSKSGFCKRHEAEEARL